MSVHCGAGQHVGQSAAATGGPERRRPWSRCILVPGRAAATAWGIGADGKPVFVALARERQRIHQRLRLAAETVVSVA